MIITEERKDKVLVLAVEGRLDSSTSAQLEKKLLAVMDSGETYLILDFASMDYISSAGLRVLLMAAKRIGKAEGKLVLAALSANVKEVFDITGFTDIFIIAESREEAFKAF